MSSELEIQTLKVAALQAEATAKLANAIIDLTNTIKQLKGDLP